MFDINYRVLCDNIKSGLLHSAEAVRSETIERTGLNLSKVMVNNKQAALSTYSEITRFIKQH